MIIDKLQKWFDEKILTKEQNGIVYIKKWDSDHNTDKLHLRKTGKDGYKKYELSYLGNRNLNKVFLYKAEADDGTFYKFYGSREFYVCTGSETVQEIKEVYKPRLMGSHGYVLHLLNAGSTNIASCPTRLKL